MPFTSSFILHPYSIITVSFLVASVLNSASDRLANFSLLNCIFSGALFCSFIWAIFFLSQHACYVVRGGALGIYLGGATHLTALWCGLDEYFFFSSLVVRLPYSSIFWQFCLFFVFNFVVVLSSVQGGTVCLPTPPSWPAVPSFLTLVLPLINCRAHPPSISLVSALIYCFLSCSFSDLLIYTIMSLIFGLYSFPLYALYFKTLTMAFAGPNKFLYIIVSLSFSSEYFVF